MADTTDDKVVLLVELAGGEVVGRPRVVTARSLAVGVAVRAQRERPQRSSDDL